MCALHSVCGTPLAAGIRGQQWYTARQQRQREKQGVHRYWTKAIVRERKGVLEELCPKYDIGLLKIHINHYKANILIYLNFKNKNMQNCHVRNFDSQ